MTFNSLAYFIFLPLVYLLFFLSGDRLRWLVLLFASYLFYAAWGAPHLLLALALVSLVTYLCGIRIGDSREERGRRIFFWAGTSFSLLMLVVVKYLGPCRAETGNPFIQKLAVSIGVSYFTFQAISYLADVYFSVQEPERHAGYHALSLAFFPKLLQGPIERAGALLPQLKKPYRFDYQDISGGLLLFSWGMLKKVVVADRLAAYVNPVYGDVHSMPPLALLLGTYAFAFQIYFDFSGYTDMARGTARIFGISLTENFNAPYLASSIADFWRRWHISFSRWILDYIFQPLQMLWRDLRQAGTALALLATFLISGIWHGASWGFVAWGVLHGCYLAASIYYKPYQKRWHKRLGVSGTGPLKLWQTAVTFHLVCFAWIFFRAESIADAFYVAETLCGSLLRNHAPAALIPPPSTTILAIPLAIGPLVLLVEQGREKHRLREIWTATPALRWAGYYLLLCGTITLGVAGASQFIYFKF